VCLHYQPKHTHAGGNVVSVKSVSSTPVPVKPVEIPAGVMPMTITEKGYTPQKARTVYQNVSASGAVKGKPCGTCGGGNVAAMR
jgi:hypothetical protein